MRRPGYNLLVMLKLIKALQDLDLAAVTAILDADPSLATAGDAKGKQAKGQKLPKGQLDGVVTLEGGELLVSSWEGSAIYRGKPGGEWKPVVENAKSPADIGYDTKRKRVLIPSFMGNSVTLHPLE